MHFLDDLWKSKKLEKQIQFMQISGCAISCTSYEKIQEDGTMTGKVIHSVDKLGIQRLLLDCPVDNLMVVLNQSMFTEIKVPLVDKREDFALWISLIQQCKTIYGIPEVLSFY